ncbi:MAG TPA: D-alanyl-D-alanine carboxypeptidase [Thermoanaerobacterales bacterium]|nr:D-alanyl-D-alanine carboxypeptidase [Thermoanaerobacterales bacterium]
MRKIFILLLICLFLFSIPVYASNIPDINANSAILMDIDSGRILYDKNINEKRPMASTTKIMTAIIALELGNLQDSVQVSENSAKTEGSSIWLEAGEFLTLEELIYGLMLNSGNDAAVAIAEHIGGSVDGFAKLMNDKAKEIGAENTNFANPHGLHDKNHYTTAHDLALITRYALLNPIFKQIVKTSKKTIPWLDKEWDRQLQNRNKLLWQLEGADGVKTGYTSKAGRCLVASATRQNQHLLSVILSSSSIFEESKKLLEYGFNNYTNNEILNMYNSIGNINVKDGSKDFAKVYPEKNIRVPLKSNEKNKVAIQIEAPDTILAPFKKGQTIGRIKATIGNEILGTCSLIIREDINKKKNIYNFFSNIFIKLLKNVHITLPIPKYI